MGTTTTPVRLTDAARAQRARVALRDGTAARLRDLRGWTRPAMARRFGIPGRLLLQWERGTARPTPQQALTVWQVLVEACIYTPQPPDPVALAGEGAPTGAAHRSAPGTPAGG